MLSKLKQELADLKKLLNLLPLNRILNGRLTFGRALGLVFLLAWLILCIYTGFAVMNTQDIACEELRIWDMVGYLWYSTIMMVLGSFPFGMILIGIISWHILQDDEGYKEFKRDIEEWKNR